MWVDHGRKYLCTSFTLQSYYKIERNYCSHETERLKYDTTDKKSFANSFAKDSFIFVFDTSG